MEDDVEHHERINRKSEKPHNRYTPVESFIRSLISCSIDIVDKPATYFVSKDMVYDYERLCVENRKSYYMRLNLSADNTIQQMFILPVEGIERHRVIALTKKLIDCFSIIESSLHIVQEPHVVITEDTCTITISHNLTTLTDGIEGAFMKISACDASFIFITVLPRQLSGNANYCFFPVDSSKLELRSNICDICGYEYVELMLVLQLIASKARSQTICVGCRLFKDSKLYAILKADSNVEPKDSVGLVVNNPQKTMSEIVVEVPEDTVD